MPLLTVQNISMSYGERRVLDGVNFRVNQGDRIAFIGDNGAGKSTLFKIIKGLITPDGGDVICHGNTIVGFLSQNMSEQDLSGNTLKPVKLIDLETKLHDLERAMSKSEGDELSDLMNEYSNVQAEYESIGGYDYDHRLNDALGGLGLSGISDRTDFTGLSGGEKMRVCLARLIVERPDILMLDEPTNHLDMEAIDWLEGFLSSYGGAVFVITHDRHFIDSVANRVIELDGGHITEYKGNYSDYKIQKEEFIKTQASVIANLESELEHQLEVKQTFLSHRNISGYHQREKVVEKLSDVLERERAKLPSGYAKMSFAATPRETEGRSDKILLEVKGVSKEFDGNVLFEDVSFELKADEKIFLCGPNGCGKTTMLSMLSGKASGASGTVLIAPSITCGFMGQFVPFDDESITCFDELISRSDLQTTEARSLLARFGFRGEDVFKTIDMLSGGERSRLYLCCLLNENPDILFLDEPTNHLDINSREILEDAIREYPRAVICVSHDRFFIDKCADKVMGFIGTSVKSYDKYEFYRKDMNSVAAVVKQEPEKPVKKPRQVKSSKEAGQRRARLRDLEKEIASLEDQQKELEAAFGVNAKGDEYKKYGEIAEKLELLYDEYFALSEES
ncbi:MAG: ABC-F family ATP-binding cassette domain-containing protein [Clostridiales bacterium]|nr:ABC-F family ATP-binding cassette domain-containing protein [Clostridiales bacterium]